MYSMNKMTPRRRAIYNFILDRVAVQGQPPTLAEIGQACGMSSRGSVRKHVQALADAGLIKVAPGQARGAKPGGPSARIKLLKESNLFEISKGDIAALDDSDLRELAAKLSTATLVEQGQSGRHVTWGGDQNAGDGGIDVRVEQPAGADHGYLPRKIVGMQVKATSMPRGEIQKEMCPNGVLRPAIRALIKVEGAYLIISSESTTDSSYQARRQAMQEAASSEPGYEHAEFDFYDAQRMADWTNRHPGVVAWVRERLGRPLQGWRPYGQWAAAPGGQASTFIDDEAPRLIGPGGEDNGLPLKQALQHVRSLLRQGGRSVRIAGLSGVGKTRFAQALFESQAAEDPLDSNLAVYTDISETSSPSPLAVLDQMMANRRRAVMVVDNCSSSLHRQLTERCVSSGTVSLLTIEYDIRDDLPEETDIFRMEAASGELISEVIKQQFPHISQVDRATITRFADGNSRVAIALATTLDKRDTLAGIANEELFRRLFWQKHDPTDSLLRAAQACALVYSFDGENAENELPQLAPLAGTGTVELFREARVLQARGLAQKRGVWRAILPHAIANVLAAQALSLLPRTLVLKQLVEGQDRLFRSFSRRLGFLDQNEDAREIVQHWLSEDGLLGDVASLDGLKSDVLRNVAPIDPEAVLVAIERAARGDNAEALFAPENTSRVMYTHLLRSIAWEARYFDRCMSLLVRFALAEPEDQRSDSVRSLIKSMFAMYLSGTHATGEQRVEWIRRGLESQDPRMQRLAIDCLEAALEAYHFSSHYGFDFGSQSRDYGCSPRFGSEVQQWLTRFIELAVEFGKGDSDLAESVRNVLATKFRSLWSVARVFDALEAAVHELIPLGWERGWLAIRQTMRFDSKANPAQSRTRLAKLEHAARPITLIDQIKAVVLTSYSSGVDITDGEDDVMPAHERADRRAQELGQQVAKDADVLEALLPLLMVNRQGRHNSFGRGLAVGAAEPFETWQALVSGFKTADPQSRNVQVLNGFLAGIYGRDRALFERLLDEALDDSIMAEWVPILQVTTKLDHSGWARLMRSLANNSANVHQYQYLAYGSVTNQLEDDELAQLLQAIADKDDGVSVALDILSLHLHGLAKDSNPKALAVGRSLLPKVPLLKHQHQLDFALGTLVERCLSGPEGEESARALLTILRAGLTDYTISTYDFEDLILGLFKVQPLAALDALVDGDSEDTLTFVRARNLEATDEGQHNPLANVPAETLLGWCRAGSSRRWIQLASVVPALASANDGKLRWTDIALDLIKQSPEPNQVIGELLGRLSPTSWGGSRAEIMSARMHLFDGLESMMTGDTREKLKLQRANFEEQIARERQWELKQHRQRNERFE